MVWINKIFVFKNSWTLKEELKKLSKNKAEALFLFSYFWNFISSLYFVYELESSFAVWAGLFWFI